MRYSIGFGPFRVYGGGRRRRRASAPAPAPGSAAEIIATVVVMCVCGLFIGILFQSAIAGWIIAIGGSVLGAIASRAMARNAQTKRRAREERLGHATAQLALHRATMSTTNTPWYDAVAGHYRHSTCTIKHKGAGAAQRCKSRS